MRLAALAAAFVLSPVIAFAQPPTGVAPGSAAAALGVSTRDRSNPPTGAGALQLPIFPIGQVESCTAAELTAGFGSLRTGALVNLFGAAKGCERRRDAWFMAATGDLDAARNRMCQEALNRVAYEGTSHPCPALPARRHWWSW